MKATMPQHNMIAAALAQSFHKWASNHERFKKLYKRMPGEILKIIEAGLSEVEALTPMSWDQWWLKEHNRFRGTEYRQEDKRFITQLIHQFLSDFSRGKIDAVTTRKRSAKKSGGKTQAEQERRNKVRGDESGRTHQAEA